MPDRIAPSDVYLQLHEVARVDTPPANADLARALSSGLRLVVLTMHRRESWGDPMKSVAAAVREVVDTFADVVVVCPMHPNPRVRATLTEELGSHERIVLTEPLVYRDLVTVLRRAYLILTDSGGIQEEAPTFGVPVLVLRENTERPEAIAAGCAQLVGVDPREVLDTASRLLLDDNAYRAMAINGNPYGDGHAAERAVAAIAELVGVGSRLPDFHVSNVQSGCEP